MTFLDKEMKEFGKSIQINTHSTRSLIRTSQVSHRYHCRRKSLRWIGVIINKELLGVIINNHLDIKLHVEHIERVFPKQNERYKTKFNQSYPMDPSILNFYKTIHGLCLYGSHCTKWNTDTDLKWFKTVVSAIQEDQFIVPVFLIMDFVPVAIL